MRANAHSDTNEGESQSPLRPLRLKVSVTRTLQVRSGVTTLIQVNIKDFFFLICN